MSYYPKGDRVLGVAAATRYPSAAAGLSSAAGTATAALSRLSGTQQVTLYGYMIDVAAAGRIVCVDHGGTDIDGTGITLVAGSLPGYVAFPIPIRFTATPGAAGGANVGIKLAAGITASLLFETA